MSAARVHPIGRLALAVALLGAVGAVTGRAFAREGRFPHARHAGLFPTCVGCHEGIISGADESRFPAPETCSRCHDGSRVARVEWSGPAPAPSNLAFSHVRHAREVAADSQASGGGTGDPALQCGGCHRMAGDTRFLAVERARPATCLSCHAHVAPAHLDERNDCRSCHVTLARATTLPVERIAAFPRPPSHDAPEFVRRHAPADEAALARCATCHAQQTCARCHADARRDRRIAALAPDARVARLVAGRVGTWPPPPSHERRDWAFEHGREASRAPARCATCHAQPSCRGCHIGAGATKQIRRLPAPDSGASPGVQLRIASARTDWHATSLADGALASTVDSARSRLTRVHAPNYARLHGAEASARQLDCSGCHEQRFCADCHAGEGRRRFHPANFVQRHAPEAWGREQDCASCHNPEAFCRTCHVASGLASKGGLNSAYHTRQPGWLLQHGQAARQGLESCTTCHAQRDCMQCHSRAGWNVSPHGRDFDAARMSRRARGMCTACHVGDPLARGR